MEYLISVLFGAYIKHIYDQKILKTKNQKEIIFKSEIVAELLAEWIRKDKDGKYDADYYRLNKMAFQAFLWLPEKEAKELSGLLSHNNPKLSVRKMIKSIRTHLQGKEDGLGEDNINIFQF
ncbi:MAG: hypothetical protein LGB07_00845 [Sulfurovum sp.]|nr:hypothetical protein [Sulfurovum sp.]